MDLGTGPEAEEFRSEIASWLDGNVPTKWRFLAENDTTDEELVEIRREWGRRLYAAKLLGPGLPREHGGMGLGVEQAVVYAEEYARAGAPEPANANAIDIFLPSLMRFGSASQKSQIIEPMLRHDQLWCQGFSEPEAGSDLAAVKTRAVLEGETFRITGQKVWTSLAHFADYCYVLVRTDPDSQRHAGLSLLAVSMRQPGIEARPVKQITGRSEFCEVFFDGAKAGTGDVIGGIGDGWRVAMDMLGQERSVRLAMRAFRLRQTFDELRRLTERVDAPSGQASVRARLAELFVSTLVMNSVARRNVALAASGEDFTAFAAMGKLTWSEASQEQAHFALDILGPDAVQPQYQHWVDAVLTSRAMSIYGGTSQIQRNIIAGSAGLQSYR
jgi:alkylation response protein AidB-like acyl-CoA dehydrogenase